MNNNNRFIGKLKSTYEVKKSVFRKKVIAKYSIKRLFGYQDIEVIFTLSKNANVEIPDELEFVISYNNKTSWDVYFKEIYTIREKEKPL